MRTNRIVALIFVISAIVGSLAGAATAQAGSEKPSASEVGVTPTEIHIAVMADVDTPIIPNVFIGARNAVEGFAKYINSSCATRNKCLAGRKLVVDFYDSQLNPNVVRNDEIKACSNDLAMVGSSTLLVTSVHDMRNCKDQKGTTTGIPEIPVIASALAQLCSNESFPVLPPSIRCDTKDQHPQTYVANVGRGYYFTKKYGDLHGVYLLSPEELGHTLPVRKWSRRRFATPAVWTRASVPMSISPSARRTPNDKTR